MNYFLKFKNFQSHPEGTGKLHYQVLQKEGRVLWGQWRKGETLLSRRTKEEMNTVAPFTLYILDKDVALLQLTVEKVYDREEVIEAQLTDLIPTYYDIDTPCSAFYLVSNIEILPPEEAIQIVNINTGTSIYYSAQVNSTTPWRVKKTTDPILAPVKIPTTTKNDFLPPASVSTDNINNSNTYWIYKYQSQTTGKSYIGMTNNLTRRRKEHENPATWKREKKKYLYVMMSFLGIDDFTFEVLHEGLTEEEAHHWEAKEIENHNSYYPNGLNERNESRYL